VCSWASEGEGQRGLAPSKLKNGCFLNFKWLKRTFVNFSPPGKTFVATPGKSTIGLPLEKILPTPMDVLSLRANVMS